jgi:hypothetical protein
VRHNHHHPRFVGALELWGSALTYYLDLRLLNDAATKTKERGATVLASAAVTLVEGENKAKL